MFLKDINRKKKFSLAFRCEYIFKRARFLFLISLNNLRASENIYLKASLYKNS